MTARPPSQTLAAGGRGPRGGLPLRRVCVARQLRADQDVHLESRPGPLGSAPEKGDDGDPRPGALIDGRTPMTTRATSSPCRGPSDLLLRPPPSDDIFSLLLSTPSTPLHFPLPPTTPLGSRLPTGPSRTREQGEGVGPGTHYWGSWTNSL